MLLSFYDLPAEHWKHILTRPGLRQFRGEWVHWTHSKTPFTPIESTFATVRQRTGKTKGCLSRKTGLAMAFWLMMSAQSKW